MQWVMFLAQRLVGCVTCYPNRLHLCLPRAVRQINRGKTGSRGWREYIVIGFHPETDRRRYIDRLRALLTDSKVPGDSQKDFCEDWRDPTDDNDRATSALGQSITSIGSHIPTFSWSGARAPNGWRAWPESVIQSMTSNFDSLVIFTYKDGPDLLFHFVFPPSESDVAFHPPDHWDQYKFQTKENDTRHPVAFPLEWKLMKGDVVFKLAVG